MHNDIKGAIILATTGIGTIIFLSILQHLYPR